jgi:glycosyltransferase involved in cell wall biosynthesis
MSYDDSPSLLFNIDCIVQPHVFKMATHKADIHILIHSGVPCSVRNNGDAFNVYAVRLSNLFHEYGHRVYFYGNTNYHNHIKCKKYVKIMSEDDTRFTELLKTYGSFNDCNYLTWRHSLENLSIVHSIDVSYHTAVFNILKDKRHKYTPQNRGMILSTYQHMQELVKLYDSTSLLSAMYVAIHPCLMGIKLAENMSYSGNYVFCSEVYKQFMKRYVIQFNDENLRERFAVINPLFDTNDFTYSKYKKDQTFLYLGRLEYGKGASVIFELAIRYPKMTFWIAGHRSILTEPAKLSDNIIDCGYGFVYHLRDFPNVVYHGFADTKLRRELLASATALIQFSLYDEPFGFNVIEAYLSGTPVITSNLGTFNETVKEGITGYKINVTLTEISCGRYNISYNQEDFHVPLTTIHKLSHYDCYTEGLKYTNREQTYKAYIEYFNTVMSRDQNTQ